MSVQDPVEQDYLNVDVLNTSVLLPIYYVKIVLPIMALDNAPTTVPGLKGVLNYHSDAVVIYDLGVVLGAGDTEIHQDILVILCHTKYGEVGFIVNIVNDVVSLCTERIQNPTQCPLENYFLRVYEIDEQPAWVLDVSNLVAKLSENKKRVADASK